MGNPSSLHAEGRAARALLEECRERIAASLGARATEIVFTSGGTEANRLAVLGALAAEGSGPARGAHAVVSSIEHASTLETYQALERELGLGVSWVGAGEDGRADAAAAASLLRPATRIVSLLHANNETGVVQDVAGLGEACRSRGVAFHVDAVQSLGKLPFSVGDLNADLVSLSSHKVGGPRGVGALWIRSGARFRGPHRGGPQERGHRPGTECLPGVAGFARALEVATVPGPRLRERLWEGIRARVPGALLNGDARALLPNTLNVSFPGVEAELLLIKLDLEGVAASSGSACASGARKPSHVLLAMGLPPERVRSAIRLSLGWTTTQEEVDHAAAVIGRAVADLAASPGPPRAASASPRNARGTPPSARDAFPSR